MSCRHLPEWCEIGIDEIERISPGLTVGCALRLNEFHVAVEVDVQEVQIGVTAEDAILEERRRAHSGFAATDEKLPPERFAAAREARKDLLVSARVHRSLIDRMDGVQLVGCQAGRGVLVRFAKKDLGVEATGARIVEKASVLRPPSFPAHFASAAL